MVGQPGVTRLGSGPRGGTGSKLGPRGGPGAGVTEAEPGVGMGLEAGGGSRGIGPLGVTRLGSGPRGAMGPG